MIKQTLLTKIESVVINLDTLDRLCVDAYTTAKAVCLALRGVHQHRRKAAAPLQDAGKDYVVVSRNAIETIAAGVGDDRIKGVLDMLGQTMARHQIMSVIIPAVEEHGSHVPMPQFVREAVSVRPLDAPVEDGHTDAEALKSSVLDSVVWVAPYVAPAETLLAKASIAMGKRNFAEALRDTDAAGDTIRLLSAIYAFSLGTKVAKAVGGKSSTLQLAWALLSTMLARQVKSAEAIVASGLLMSLLSSREEEIGKLDSWSPMWSAVEHCLLPSGGGSRESVPDGDIEAAASCCMRVVMEVRRRHQERVGLGLEAAGSPAFMDREKFFEALDVHSTSKVPQ